MDIDTFGCLYIWKDSKLFEITLAIFSVVFLIANFA